jgi:sugar lactone lactonase YvrE
MDAQVFGRFLRKTGIALALVPYLLLCLGGVRFTGFRHFGSSDAFAKPAARAWSSPEAPAPGTIVTVAGTSRLYRVASSSAATDAPFSYFLGSVAVSPRGYAVIADAGSHRVWKLTSTGFLVPLAGTGKQGFSGEDAPARQALLNHPYSVAIGADGCAFVADSDNHRIRKIDRKGRITTFAGTGTPGFSGDGGPAAQAALNFPLGLATDTVGNLFVADTRNRRIRRIDRRGIITTIAGNGQSGYPKEGALALQSPLDRPEAIAIDPEDHFYLADGPHNCIRKVNDTGHLITIAGTGDAGYSGDGKLAVDAQFRGPKGLAFDSHGNLFVADTYNHAVRKITPSGYIQTIAGTGREGFAGDGGPAGEAQLDYPTSLAVDAAGNLFIADMRNRRIREVFSLETSAEKAAAG